MADEMTADILTSLSMADRHIVSKPGKCPTDPALFDDWKFELENYMSVIKPEFGSDMQVALATVLNPGEMLADTGDPELRKRSVLLYGVLASLTTGKVKLLVKKYKATRNGFAVWRMINDEYIPRTSEGRKLYIAMELTTWGSA